jgi:CheY-like chemotaxis protein
MINYTGTKWRFLIVEDKDYFVRQILEAVPSFVDPPDKAEAEACTTFAEAADKLVSQRFDLLILDLKDDSDKALTADNNPLGLATFAKLKKTRFVPVVFYTALAHKVRSEQTSFVRVVEKTEGIKRVREEVRRVLATRLPMLIRRIEETQRNYMWEFINTHWKDFQEPAEQAEVVYLLARRLALSMEATANELVASIAGTPEAPTEGGKAHPMIMYVVPPMETHPLAGNIVSESVCGKDEFWIILTPSCDFAQSKANHVILAKCERLAKKPEYKKWLERKDKPNVQRLEQLVEDKRGDRFKFLPGAFFIPDLVVDFQQLRSISLESLKDFKAIATLDSPFAESVLARFSRYFNRLGTPDIDKNIVIGRLQTSSGVASL